jgi:hypothetical protein
MNSHDAAELPPAERAAHYRELAQDMQSRAVNAINEDIRSAYLKIAVEWLDMADRLEADFDGIRVTVESDLASLLW